MNLTNLLREITYVLAPGSPNYILSLPLEVQKINFEIENFERVETIVNE